MFFRSICMLALVSLPSCSEAAAPGPHAQATPGESAQFFAAAVEHFTRDAEYPVRVDPRPLRPESRLRSVTHSDILLPDTASIRVRTAVLAASDIPIADATEDWRCVFTEGMRGPAPGERGGTDPIWEQMRASEPDSLRARREACQRGGRFESLAFGLPQAGTDPENPQWWRIRAMRMLLHGWEIVDLFLEPDSRGEWQVVKERVRVGAFS